MEFFKKTTHLRFMEKRKVWYGVSALLFVASLGSLATRGLNLGVDFTGGVTIEAAFTREAPIDALRAGLAAAGFVEPLVQNFGTSRDVAIRLPPPKGQTSDQVRAGVERVLRSIDEGVEVRRVEIVGPQVGQELRTSAWQSLLATIILIFIYVLVRFHTIKLSSGAIIAALHDPVIVLGFFSWTGLTFDLSVMAAILAVIGYSLNDTVVVYDRIRERFETSKRSSPIEVLNLSVNQTLSRTIMTSSTTLIVGILVGTYSSIYVSAAVALDMGLKAEDLFPTSKKMAIDNMP